jgi:hypothetical protein
VHLDLGDDDNDNDDDTGLGDTHLLHHMLLSQDRVRTR